MYKFYFSLPYDYVYDWSYGIDGAHALSNKHGYDIQFIRNNWLVGHIITEDLYSVILEDESEKLVFVLKTGFKDVVA